MHTRQIQTAIIFQEKALKALQTFDEEKLKGLEARDILKFFETAAKIERETRERENMQAARDAGEDGSGPSLADAIVQAYKKRQEDG